jgi:hypothetical protein
LLRFADWKCVFGFFSSSEFGRLIKKALLPFKEKGKVCSSGAIYKFKKSKRIPFYCTALRYRFYAAAVDLIVYG